MNAAYKARRHQIEAEKTEARRTQLEARMQRSAEREQWITTVQAALRLFEHSGFRVSPHRDDLWIVINGRRFDIVVAWGVRLRDAEPRWLARICIGGESTWQECDDLEKFPEWFGNWVAEAVEKHK